MKKLQLSILIISLVSICTIANGQSSGDFYQINVYHTASQAQLDSVNTYIKNNYVAQLHNAGFSKVGVFMPIANDTSADKRIVVLIPLKSLDQLSKIALDAAAPKYKRLESIVLSAFPDAPKWQMPELKGNVKDRVYELRSYESATEERHQKKVEMFNKGGEVKLFKRLDFNAVFYAKVLIGSRMPNLMYMTSFDNMTAHDEHWKAFGADAEWKQLSGLPEYANTVQHIDITLMHAADYSDIK
ncbi:NIPSNAP family protein [Mucilaginibacter ginkgonis]|uniref:NIPSNAP family protein n=1 Tax=Mucilaginibacter ginkgonis TaxID=2682091 RepID=A0A6I4HX00_9SPHI|nr:NIPSNAP family protein [Mucilaginibacter ginkgonis]QQL49864.1 NIPSNAP family protein [Mucilaginibacter ginkgonis]